MRTTITLLLISLSITAWSQDTALINNIFDKIEVQGIDTKQNLLYGYYFVDKSKAVLEKLQPVLAKQSYKFVSLEKMDDGQYMLQVEKIEHHTRQSIFQREQELNQLAIAYHVGSFDGFDVGNIDPSKLLVSNDGFLKFMRSKKGDELFALAVRLYDLEVNDRATQVFKACIQQHIKADTAAFKLGNILINDNKIQEGIAYLKQAVSINAKYVAAYFNLGATCYDAQQFQSSLDYYKRADILQPNNDQIFYGIAAAQYALKQFEASLLNCKKALKINPGNSNTQQLLTMLQQKGIR